MLTEALPIARAMKNEGLIARIVTTQGDVLYYKGDFAGARKGYQDALAASRSSEAAAGGVDDPAESRESGDERRKGGAVASSAEPTELGRWSGED